MKTKEIKKLKDRVKNQIGKEQPSGFKLLTNYYPDDAKDQIDDIFKIIEADLYQHGIDPRFASEEDIKNTANELANKTR